MSARSLLWAKDYANMLSGHPATGPGPAAGFRHLGPSAGTLNFMNVSAEQHGETALGRVYMGGLPGRSVGFRSVDYKK